MSKQCTYCTQDLKEKAHHYTEYFECKCCGNYPGFPFGPIPHWIKCVDRLPNDDEYVIVSDRKDIYILKFTQTTDKRHKTRAGYFSSSDDGDYFDPITHWMPLPPIPNE